MKMMTGQRKDVFVEKNIASSFLFYWKESLTFNKNSLKAQVPSWQGFEPCSCTVLKPLLRLYYYF